MTLSPVFTTIPPSTAATTISIQSPRGTKSIPCRSIQQRLRDVADSFNRDFERELLSTPFTWEAYCHDYRNHTVRELLARKAIPYLTCLERHLVIAYLARQADIETIPVSSLVVHEGQPAKLGTSLEVPLDDGIVTFVSAHVLGGDVIRPLGEPVSPAHMRVLRALHPPALDDRWCTCFGYDSLFEFLTREFPEIDLRLHHAKVVEMNTAETRQGILFPDGHHP